MGNQAGDDSLLGRVPKRYRDPLPPDLGRLLRRSAAAWPDPERVLGNLDGLLRHGTDSKAGYAPTLNLKKLLGEIDFFEADGEDKWFWELFPEPLEMRHLVAVYEVCAGRKD